jgi:acyl transferase domain-containing protein
MCDDYKLLLSQDLERSPKYSANGASLSMLANRISWFFDLTGPSINLDSACSSSLMALDFACQGLRCGDTNMVKLPLQGQPFCPICLVCLHLGSM